MIITQQVHNFVIVDEFSVLSTYAIKKDNVLRLSK